VKKSNLTRDEKLALYEKLVATLPEATRKGATIPYTSLNGHMYSYFTRDDFVALKLPAEARGKFLTQYQSTLVKQYGIVQKEYVVVPDALLEKTAELKPWFKISYQYTASLKPKPTTRTKKK
jgi:hypothetical protein